MNKLIHQLWLKTLMGVVVLSVCISSIAEEPPARAARVGYLSSAVSFSLAVQSVWVPAKFKLQMPNGDQTLQTFTGVLCQSGIRASGVYELGVHDHKDILSLEQ
jgi:hypothetical protein